MYYSLISSYLIFYLILSLLRNDGASNSRGTQDPGPVIPRAVAQAVYGGRQGTKDYPRWRNGVCVSPQFQSLFEHVVAIIPER